jgi:hypothetical protein
MSLQALMPLEKHVHWFCFRSMLLLLQPMLLLVQPLLQLPTLLPLLPLLLLLLLQQQSAPTPEPRLFTLSDLSAAVGTDLKEALRRVTLAAYSSSSTGKSSSDKYDADALERRHNVAATMMASGLGGGSSGGGSFGEVYCNVLFVSY